MALTLTTPNTVLGALLPKERSARLAAQLVTVVLGSLLLWASAKISVPVTPVPVSLQSLAVALVAGTFGWRVGVATLTLYMVEGLSGLPVFAYGGGAQYLVSPSFGFILGFIPMAYIIGRAADLGNSGRVVQLFLAAMLGLAVLYAFGFAWLLAVATVLVQSGGELPKWIDATNLVGTAWAKAIEPFILWDTLKMAFAAVTVTGVWQLARKKA